MLRIRSTTCCAAVLAAAAALPFTALAAPAATRAESPACTATLKQIAYDTTMIARLQANLKNLNVLSRKSDVNTVRARQIQTQLTRLQADLAKATKQKAAACGRALSAFDGSYGGDFGPIHVSFTVAAGVISGDIANPTPLRPFDTRTGIAYAQANFVGATCGTFAVRFDPDAGTATVADLTCTLAGQKLTQTVVARRAG